MRQLVKTPVEGKEIRFAPTRSRVPSLSGQLAEPASSIWKVWAEGSEVYALARGLGEMKISVHESGEIHLFQAAKQKQDLAPTMQLGTSPWAHAFELRFLLNDDALLPMDQRKSLKNKRALLISVPHGFVLYTNLIVAPAGSPLDFPLPPEFLPAGVAIWRRRLRNGRVAVLVGRVLALDDQTREGFKGLQDLKITATIKETAPTQGERYAELHHMYWSAGGNVILVMPVGDDFFRSEQTTVPLDTRQPMRTFRYQSDYAEAVLSAPDGKRVAVIEFPKVDQKIEVVKGQPKEVEFGQVTLRIEPNNLIPGSSFIVRPCPVACNPRIGGASFRRWDNWIRARFDGSCLSAQVLRGSGALQNKNLATPISGLEGSEEISVTVPFNEIKLSATLDQPSTSSEFIGHLTLRDRR